MKPEDFVWTEPREGRSVFDGFRRRFVAGVDPWQTNDVLAQEGRMEKRTLDQLEAALATVRDDLAPRVEELARKSGEGVLTAEERREYSDVVRLNEMLSLLKLQAEEFRSMRAAS